VLQTLSGSVTPPYLPDTPPDRPPSGDLPSQRRRS
jgi:hypothetical protein